MARSQRAPAMTPDEVYLSHAAEARTLASVASDDAGRVAFDRAASAHETAARLHRYALRCAARGAVRRQAAAAARARRLPGIAAQADADAAEYEAAAAAARAHAERWNGEGHMHAASATRATEPDETPEAPPPASRRRAAVSVDTASAV